MKALRLAIAIPGIAVLVWLGWTIIQVTRADELAHDHPEAALEIDPDHPQALLRLAKQQLEDKKYDAAAETARHLLGVEPGQGDAFAVLALAANGTQADNLVEVTKIAVQRAPRDVSVRLQELVFALQDGDMPGAAKQLDAALRVSPRRGEVLYQAMASQTMIPAFRDALLDRIALKPAWVDAFLRQVAYNSSPEAVDRIFGGLHERSLLSKVHLAEWIDRKIRDGKWQEARTQWISILGQSNDGNHFVFNGDFEDPISDMGFDWRRVKSEGVFSSIDRVFDDGQALHFHFIGRPAAGGDVRQMVLLGSGRYRISLRARGDFLHSEKGLQWVVRCDQGRALATIGPLEGSFDWERFSREFVVPAEGCPTQWLELRNPAVRGSAQHVSGDLWVDDVSIEAM